MRELLHIYISAVEEDMMVVQLILVVRLTLLVRLEVVFAARIIDVGVVANWLACEIAVASPGLGTRRSQA